MTAPTAPAPPDQAQRDRIRDDHGTSVFVEAGAGTGKTSAIVARVVAMVSRGQIELRALAAITFTEAAASELRDRIRHQLELAAAGRDLLVVEDQARERCRRALDQLDEAALTTLHGFAQGVLGEHPLEAGLPPGFEVMDDIRARLAFEQRWAEFVDETYAEERLAPLLLRGLVLGLGPDQLREVARTLDEQHDRLPDAPGSSVDEPSLDLDAVVARFDALDQLRRDHCRDDGDRLATHIDGLRPARHRLRACTDDLDAIEALLDLPPLRSRHGRRECWDVDVATVRAATAELDELVEATLAGQRRAVLSALVDRVLTFVRAGAATRRRSGALEFHDLLVLTRDLLRRDHHVRDALRSRWRCILLDEFQDTDPLQIEIATLIATDDPHAGDRPWTEIVVRPGALVVVGDPKQSIYRFRRADMRVYHEARSALGLAPVELVANFRSVPGVIEFVNHVQRQLLEERPGMQAGHVELHAHRAMTLVETSPGDGRTSVHIYGAGTDADVGRVRMDEAAETAALIARIKAEGWPVREVGDDTRSRPARYQDIALLIPSRTVLPGLENALGRAGIPVRVESQSLLFSTADIQDLLAALTAVDDPTDEIAVVAALRSPAFGCRDTDLLEFVAHGGRWDHRWPPPATLDPGHPVSSGLASLRGFWEQRWWRSVSQTVEAVVRERRVLELALARPRHRDHWRRVRYLLDQARAWDDAGNASLRRFVAWIGLQADEQARVLESVAPEPDDDAVRILTVHGAKGLEFPIVVLAGLNTVPARPVRGVVWTANGAEFGFGTKRARTWTTTEGFEAASRDEDEHEAAERLRLLYVAMTRARDHLALSLHHKIGTDTHAARLVGCLDGAPYASLSFEDADRVRPSSPPSVPPDPVDPTERPAWLAERERVLAHAGRPESIAATALARHPHEGEGDEGDGAAGDGGETGSGDERSPWRRGRAGTAVGRAVHAVLQSIDLATGDGLEATARAQAFAEQIPTREAEVRDLADVLRRSPSVQAAFAAGARHWREVPVGAPVGGVLVEGFIDLLVESADGVLTVVDYKTDRVPADADLDAALARYTPQGAAYALALETALGRPVGHCVFVFARPDGAAERAVPDLASATAAVRAQVTAQVTARAAVTESINGS